MKVTDNAPSPESHERQPSEVGIPPLPEALSTEVKQESAEMPVEQSKVEEEKTEVEPSGEERSATPNQIEEEKVDEDKEKVMRHFLWKITSVPFQHHKGLTVKRQSTNSCFYVAQLLCRSLLKRSLMKRSLKKRPLMKRSLMKRT